MFEQLKKAASQFAAMFGELPIGKKIALGVVGVMVLLGILATSYFSSIKEYSVLYGNLSQGDVLAITEKLKERQITYRLNRNGTGVSVPVTDVYQLRLELAGEGLPSGGGVGFEIFDKSTFGMTEFLQKINFKRALQGELQRTINSIASVHSSRVHIVMPEKTLFKTDGNKSKASVVLKLKGRRSINKSQVDGIGYLVAAAVEGLLMSDVTIVDSSGNILSSSQDDTQMGRLAANQMEYKRTFEMDMEKRLRTMLERAVGNGKAIVRVNANIDYKQVQRTEETFDPESQVARSEQRNEEKSSGAVVPAGAVGVQSNLPEGTEARQLTGKPAQSSKVNETINYEINKVVQTVIEPTNQIKKLSVAVMVDGKYTETTGEEGATAREFQPLSAEELGRLENLVRSAIGFDANRQDVVTIESIQFDMGPLMAEARRLEEESQREFITNIISYAGMGVVGLVIFLFVLRPIMAWISQSGKEVDELRMFPKTVTAMEQELASLTKPEERAIDYRKRVSDIAEESPDAAAEIVRLWLKRTTRTV